MNRGGYPGDPFTTLTLMAVLAVAVWTMLIVAIRNQRPQAGPQPRRAPAFVYGLTATIIVCMILLAVRPASGRAADPPASSAWRWILFPVAVVALTVGLLAIRRLRPASQALRRASRGDLDGAATLLRAAINLRMERIDVPPPASTTPGPGRDFEAPRTTTRPAEAQSLAGDWNVLGIIEQKRENWASALAAFRQADRFNATGDPTIRQNLAAALIRVGRVAEGIAEFRRALAALPAPQGPFFALLQIALAEALLDQGQTAEVAAILDAAVQGSLGGRVFPARSRGEFQARIEALRVRVGALRSAELATGGPAA